MNSGSEEKTVYRSRLLAGVVCAAGVYGTAMMVFILAFGSPGAGESVKVGVGLVLSLWAIFRLSRCGVYVDDDGIRVLNPVSSTHLRWDEIRRFVLIDRGPCLAERVDGSTVKLFGIQQPTFVLPRGRRTQAAVLIDDLNRRLSVRRADHAFTP